jgi:NAD(P)H-hydrate epimerase
MLRDATTLSERIVVSVDLPSGMNPDDGSGRSSAMSDSETGAILPADITVTFGALKPLHALAPARDNCGIIHCVDIGFPATAVAKALANDPARFLRANDQLLLEENPWAALKPSAHKFDRGHILVLGGSAGKTGAPFLTGIAALRTGAGWVSLSLPDDASDGPDFATPPELTYEKFWVGSIIDATKVAGFVAERKVKTIVIGPGTMSQPIDENLATWLAAFTKIGGSVVIDAGATQGILEYLRRFDWSDDKVLCTPHPGEWQKLNRNDSMETIKRIGLPVSQESVLAAPQSIHGLEALQSSLEVISGSLVHKGATPVIVGAGGKFKPAVVCCGGSKILARAGSGDVIAGVVAAHLAMGLQADIAFARGFAQTARAAKIAAKRVGDDAVLATDILSCLGIER